MPKTPSSGLALATRCLCVAAACLFLGCSAGAGSESAPVRSAVIAGLVATAGGALTSDQIATFRADIQDPWAVVYDPADPPGCVPGGLWASASSPGIPELPCKAYLMERRKARWTLRASGSPGKLQVPDEAPKELGSPSRLVYLAP